MTEYNETKQKAENKLKLFHCEQNLKLFSTFSKQIEVTFPHQQIKIEIDQEAIDKAITKFQQNRDEEKAVPEHERRKALEQQQKQRIRELEYNERVKRRQLMEKPTEDYFETKPDEIQPKLLLKDSNEDRQQKIASMNITGSHKRNLEINLKKAQRYKELVKAGDNEKVQKLDTANAIKKLQGVKVRDDSERIQKALHQDRTDGAKKHRAAIVREEEAKKKQEDHQAEKRQKAIDKRKR